MPRPRPSRPLQPLDLARLDALAVHYLGRYATTQARLAAYLRRKLAERGWTGEGDPPVDNLVSRCAAAGYVDDRAFAEARAATLARRGYGQRRVRQSLSAAGVARDIADSLAPDRDTAYAAAESYARRRKFGPFGDGSVDAAQRRRQFAAMVRAGHDFELARHFVTAPTDDAKSDHR